ncbi:hypothetical protein IL306_012543, partial [Fusarium sp. DS 682]
MEETNYSRHMPDTVPRTTPAPCYGEDPMDVESKKDIAQPRTSDIGEGVTSHTGKTIWQKLAPIGPPQPNNIINCPVDSYGELSND